MPVINQYVAPATIVLPDEWRGYQNLRQTYQHLTVNHSVQFVNQVTQGQNDEQKSMGYLAADVGFLPH